MSSDKPPLDDVQKANAPVDASQVARQLAKILRSEEFEQSPRCAAFLRFVVDETLAGRPHLIKARTIAIYVFERRPEGLPGWAEKRKQRKRFRNCSNCSPTLLLGLTSTLDASYTLTTPEQMCWRACA
jgi:hypothetical protein